MLYKTHHNLLERLKFKKTHYENQKSTAVETMCAEHSRLSNN